MIRLLLIEDQALARESLSIALAGVGDLELRSCASIQEGIGLLADSSNAFDIVLVKQRSGGQKADELLSVASQCGLANRVLVLSPGLTNLEQRRLARLGVAGIFAEQKSLADLVCAVHSVAGGQTCFEPLYAAHTGLLSPQEWVAGGLVVEGLANKEIGARMGVSESFVKAVLQRTFLKLGVRSRSQLVRILLEESSGARPPAPVRPTRSAARVRLEFPPTNAP